MGTPEFVVPALLALHESPEVELTGVVTPPDRPRGRSRQPVAPPVKAAALELGLPVFQPPGLRSAAAQERLAEMRPEVIVVAAYGRLLPPETLQLPPYGCLNLHPSLLPQGRGPSPVADTLLRGAAETGVSLMLLDEGMDTGPVLAQKVIPLDGTETAGALTETLFRRGAELLLEALPAWVAGRLPAQRQDETQATITRRLEREDGRADWTQPAALLARQQRAYTPWPGLFTTWNGQNLKLLEVEHLTAARLDNPSQETPKPGSVIAPGLVFPVEFKTSSGFILPTGFHLPVVTGDGLLSLKTLQLEGRRPNLAPEFLSGFPSIAGAVLGQ